MHAAERGDTVDERGAVGGGVEAGGSHIPNGSKGIARVGSETDDYRREMERMIARTARTVRRLVESAESGPDERSVEAAECALRTLRARIQHEGMRHQIRNEELARLQTMLAHTDDTQSRIDQAIIDARVTAGDLGMTRDSLARDVVRAKRALGALDREEGSDGTGAGSLVNDVVNHGIGSDVSRRRSSSRLSSDDPDDVILAPLQRQLTEEIKNLKLAEVQLVNVVDEINRVKKIRADLRRKMKDAEREW